MGYDLLIPGNRSPTVNHLRLWSGRAINPFRIEAFNRGPDEATLHLIPQLWFRNIWAWYQPRRRAPVITRGRSRADCIAFIADDSYADGLDNLPFRYHLGRRLLYADGDARPLFTNNETNRARVDGQDDGMTYVKDGLHRHIVNGEAAVNPANCGTKAGAHCIRRVRAGESTVMRLRLTDSELADPLADVDRVFAERLQEADEFYAEIHPQAASEDERRILSAELE